MWKMKQVTSSITLLMVLIISLLIVLCHFHCIFATPLLMIHVFQTFQPWILQHFSRISGWAGVPTYTEDMSHSTAFVLLKRNRAMEPFRVYVDRLTAKDMHFNSYVDQREMCPFNDIVLYSLWLAFGSCLTTHHLLERVMRQFSYIQIIPRHPVVSAPPTMTCRQMYVMFDDYEIHLVLEKAYNTITNNDWSYVNRYIRWFFRVPHLYMVQAASGDPPMLAYQEILEEKQTQLNHVEDVLPRCHRILEITQAGIDKCIFLDGSDVRQVLYGIMMETRGALMYQRQCQRRGGIEGQEAQGGRGGR